MSDRPVLCAACDEPSPGPIRRLYYQPRKHGPFFPILEQQKVGVKASLFSGGRVVVCTGCASHLQRQWIAFEKRWTPLEKRTYTLLAASRAPKGDDFSEAGSQDHAAKLQWRKAAKSLTVQHQIVDSFQHTSHDDDPSPVSRFRMAAQNVQHEREANPAGSSLHDVVQMARDANADYDSPRSDRNAGNLHLPVLARNSPAERRLPGGTSEFQDQLPQKLRESADILIRKVAEIQYEENLRQSQETIREALDRVKKSQDRAQFVKSLGRDLKERLYGELEFRDANRSLTEERRKKAVQALKDNDDSKHKQILKELAKEKEWQRKTEIMIATQEKRIEELRQEIKIEMRSIMEEQNRHYEELKQMMIDSRAIVPHNGSDHAYVSLDGSTHSGSNLEDLIPSRKRRRNREPSTTSALEEHSRASTPEYYIQ